MPPEHHDKIKNVARVQKKSKDEFLFMEGDAFKGFFVIGSGKLRVFNMNQVGDEATVSILQENAIVSPAPFLAEKDTYHADCQVLENAEVLFFPKEEFKKLLLDHSDLLMEFSKLVTNAVLNIRSKYLSVALKSAEQRFLEFLVQLGCENEYCELPISKKHIAALLDITPESLSRIIKKQLAKGIIGASGNQFKIISKT